MYKKLVIPTILVATLFSCQSGSDNSSSKETDTSANSTMTTEGSANSEKDDSVRHAQLNLLTVANRMDPVCGMPIMKGFDDTASYGGKLLGFCSKECRDDFQKKPDSFKIVYK